MFKKIGSALRRFMDGRYGMDQLNQAILYADLILALIALVARSTWLNLLTYIPLVYMFFRLLSKDTYRRHQENRRYLQFLDRIKDRSNRYFRCPKCKQMVRVPRGKGKVSITCPRCREKFIKKT